MIYLVYKTDSFHNYASRDIIGVADHEAHAIHICQLQAKRDSEEISEEQLFNLRNIKQTQGYSGEGEFQFEGIQENTLL
jgi:hypothetical protein